MPRGDRLQRGATGEHQADNRTRELLPQGERADHRHERDRVDPQAVLDDDRTAHLDRKLGREHGHRDSPNRLAGRPFADEV